VNDDTVSVLFVCLGNICRSPLAEAVFRSKVEEAGLGHRFRIDSAGTSGYHNGDSPDDRTRRVAARRGVQVRGSSRRITEEDVRAFDYLVAMDRDNLRNVEALIERVGANDGKPQACLFREFDPGADASLEVPDPYFGGPRGFDDVHDLVERSAEGFLRFLKQRHLL
jgi:protein-tyrosine phosphatase